MRVLQLLAPLVTTSQETRVWHVRRALTSQAVDQPDVHSALRITQHLVQEQFNVVKMFIVDYWLYVLVERKTSTA